MWQTIIDFLSKWPILLLVAAVIWFLVVIGVIVGIVWLGMCAVFAIMDCLASWLGSAKIARFSTRTKQDFKNLNLL
jgi:hypothetical protein